MTTPICLWSGPRNVSTALMYSFAQRDDIRIIDEPLYGHYLRVSGADHPGGQDVMGAMNCDGDAVMRELVDQQALDSTKRLFIKHMAHHLVGLDLGFVRQTCNLFLIRDPKEMLPSLTVQVPHAQLADTGMKRQCAILDSRELLLDPEGVLRQLCDHLGHVFTADMLQWPAGPRAEDGVWAPHWYHAVHQSTGFAAYRPKLDFPAHLEPLLVECQPWYDLLFEQAIRATNSGDQP